MFVKKLISILVCTFMTIGGTIGSIPTAKNDVIMEPRFIEESCTSEEIEVASEEKRQIFTHDENEIFSRYTTDEEYKDVSEAASNITEREVNDGAPTEETTSDYDEVRQNITKFVQPTEDSFEDGENKLNPWSGNIEEIENLKFSPCGTITLNPEMFNLSINEAFSSPAESDFKDNYNTAVLIYEGILARKDYIDICFESEYPVKNATYATTTRTWDSFVSLFNEKVLHDAVELTAYRETVSTSKIRVWTGRVYTDWQSNIENSKAYYNANLSAGLYDGMNMRNAVRNINEWICQRISYCGNQMTSMESLATGRGNSYAYAQLFFRMCENAGIPCEIVTGRVEHFETQGYHYWNRVYIGDTWYHVDTCWNDYYKDLSLYLLSPTVWSNHVVVNYCEFFPSCE